MNKYIKAKKKQKMKDQNLMKLVKRGEYKQAMITLQTDGCNRNGRIYDFSLVNKSIEEVIQEINKRTKSGISEIDHPCEYTLMDELKECGWLIGIDLANNVTRIPDEVFIDQFVKHAGQIDDYLHKPKWDHCE